MYSIFKRGADILISIIALPFMLLLTIVLGILIYLEDEGPIFYKSARVGRGGKKLDMLKFRSMKVNAPDLRNSDGSTWNSDMSLIGPRASTWDALETYKSDEMDKLKVRPGITGYTQAYFRNDLPAREKRLKDAWYANNESLWLDTKIFFKTIQTVVMKKKLYTN